MQRAEPYQHVLMALISHLEVGNFSNYAFVANNVINMDGAFAAWSAVMDKKAAFASVLDKAKETVNQTPNDRMRQGDSLDHIRAKINSGDAKVGKVLDFIQLSMAHFIVL